MKIKNLIALLLLFLSFTACVERIETIHTKKHMATIPPQFSVEKETLKNRISAIIPAESIDFTSTKTTSSGEEDYHTLNVEIIPDNLPSNGIAFYRITDEIQEAIESGISNLDDYQKIEIKVHRTEEENGIEHQRSYKKKIGL